MIEAPELTIEEYLSEVTPTGQAFDSSLRARMCELLTPSLDSGTCDETEIEMVDMCDIGTSTTYTRSALDWAYQQTGPH